MTCCNHLPRHTMKWSRFLTDIPTYVDLFYMKLVQVFLSPIMLNKYYYHLYCAFITCNVFGNLEYHFHIYVWSEIVYFLRFCKNMTVLFMLQFHFQKITFLYQSWLYYKYISWIYGGEIWKDMICATRFRDLCRQVS